jgi:IclR family transcriptional regulator, acetate operon repressor
VLIDNGFQAADRVLQMLECFDEEGKTQGVSELAVRLGIHRSTASRLAATLESRGFLERVPGGRRLRLGPQMGRLGLCALGGRDLATSARPTLEALAAETGETVNLATLDGRTVVNIVQVEGKHLVGVGNWTGRRTPLHCVANGKIMLAFAGITPDSPLESFTPKTITDPTVLEAELEKIRRAGWAANVGEMEEGLHAVAVPVFDAYDRCRAALSVSAPSFRLPVRKLPELARATINAAQEISRRLGRPEARPATAPPPVQKKA